MPSISADIGTSLITPRPQADRGYVLTLLTSIKTSIVFVRNLARAVQPFGGTELPAWSIGRAHSTNRRAARQAACRARTHLAEILVGSAIYSLSQLKDASHELFNLQRIMDLLKEISNRVPDKSPYVRLAAFV
jgi:hypothetical protein